MGPQDRHLPDQQAATRALIMAAAALTQPAPPAPAPTPEPSGPEEPLAPVEVPEPGVVDVPEPGIAEIPERRP